MILLSAFVGVSFKCLSIYDRNSLLIARTYTSDIQFQKMIMENFPTAEVEALYGTIGERHVPEIYVWTKQSKDELAKEKLEYDHKMADIWAEDDKIIERREKDRERKRLKRIAKKQQL